MFKFDKAVLLLQLTSKKKFIFNLSLIYGIMIWKKLTSSFWKHHRCLCKILIIFKSQYVQSLHLQWICMYAYTFERICQQVSAI